MENEPAAKCQKPWTPAPGQSGNPVSLRYIQPQKALIIVVCSYITASLGELKVFSSFLCLFFLNNSSNLLSTSQMPSTELLTQIMAWQKTSLSWPSGKEYFCQTMEPSRKNYAF